jgi:D-alanyl-D-alanine carboxypeptidase
MFFLLGATEQYGDRTVFICTGAPPGGASLKRNLALRALPLVLALGTINLRGQSQNARSQDGLHSRFEAYLAPFVDTGNFTGAVLISRHGKVLLRQAYGLANYELRVPNSPSMRFHIASVSKAFTAAAILQLQENGLLTLSDPVSRFLPDFPQGDKIQLENLLTHTSGIRDINDLPDYDDFARGPHTLPDLVAKFAGLPLQSEPGEKYSYSNSNYNLLALILEKVSGETYPDYLRRHIFGPTGMEESGHDGDAASLIPQAAAGYVPAGEKGFEKAPYLDWSTKTGNGSLYSTVDDLYRFDRALHRELILKKATSQEYFVDGEGNRYGWYIGRRLGHRVMSAKGRSPGFTAELDRFTDDDLTIIILSNSYSTVAQDPIAEAFAAIVFGQQPVSPPMRAADVAPSVLASYEGEYQFGPDYFTPNAKFTLSPLPGCLLFQVGNNRSPLVPLKPAEFLERKFFGHVTMQKDNSGGVTGLIVRYGKTEFHAQKLPAKPSAKP